MGAPHALAAPTSLPATGLLLTGGGARAAYQVGVLEAIADLRREAGAPGAGQSLRDHHRHLGRRHQRRRAGLRRRRLRRRRAAASPTVWRELPRRAGLPRRFDRDARRRRALAPAAGRWAAAAQVAAPRAALAARQRAAGRAAARAWCRWTRLPRADARRPPAGAGRHRVELQLGRARHLLPMPPTPMEPWVRSQRIALRDRIAHAHLLASSAIPFVFPATALTVQRPPRVLRRRLDAPVGADRGRPSTWAPQRILAIGAGRMNEPRDERRRPTRSPAIRAWRRSPAMRCRASSSTRWRSTSSACGASTRRWR